MKKFFGMLVCMLLALGLVPNLAFATGENEAKIGDTEYATLQEALEHVQAGETVTLLKDVTTNNVTQNLTTDMTLEKRACPAASGGMWRTGRSQGWERAS